jgi:DNA-binding transcriptional LysR family regulator
MNIRQLEAFRATIVAGTVTGAASLMGLSQPAVSRLIEQLERSLNFSLFDRSRGRLVPTPEAYLLYEEVERTFASVDKIREIATDIHAARAGHLHIAALPALALGFVPKVVERFKKGHPEVMISLSIQTSTKIEESAAAQQIDFGFAEFPFQRSGFETEDFCRAADVLVVPASHRLAGRKQARPSDVAESPFISLTRDNVGRHLVDQIFHKAEIRRQMTIETQYSAVICSLVQLGLGVGLVDPFTAADFKGRGVVAVPFRPAMEFHIGILYPAHRPLSRVAREFLMLLRNCRNEILGKERS